MCGEKSEGEAVEDRSDGAVGPGTGGDVDVSALTVLDLCRVVTEHIPTMRKFERHDYWAFAGVSPGGLHEVSYGQNWTVVRDGAVIEVIREEPYGNGASWRITAERVG